MRCAWICFIIIFICLIVLWKELGRFRWALLEVISLPVVAEDIGRKFNDTGIGCLYAIASVLYARVVYLENIMHLIQKQH